MDREIKELITQQGHRQRYSVSTAGKEAHANGFLKEPVERKTYSFVRCMTSGQLFMMGNENLPSNALEEDWVREPELNQPDWMNKVSEHHASSLPNQSEVENALGEAYPNDTIEINSIELLGEKYLDSEAHIPIHLTLALNITKKNPEVHVHLARNELQNLTWMDELDGTAKEHEGSTKSRHKSSTQGNRRGRTSCIAYPLARLDRMLANEIPKMACWFLTRLNNLPKNIDLEMLNLDRLLANRTSICMDSTMKKGYIFNDQNDEHPTSITVPAKTAGMNKGSLAVQSGYAEVGTLTLNI